MPAITALRIHVPASGSPADANIFRRHPAEAAAWVWHPGCAADAVAILRFGLEVEGGGEVVIHVSADQRYQLRIAGSEVGYGPDRCDLQHWSVASHRVTLPAGRHRVEALVWWLGDQAPQAQVSRRGGFLLAADGAAAAAWNTGTAPWTVERLEPAVAFTQHGIATYLDVGPGFTIDCARWFTPAAAAVPAAVIEAPVEDNRWGVQRRHWRLQPTIMPEQRRERIVGGRIRAVVDGDGDGPIAERSDGRVQAWQALLAGGAAVTVPPRTSLALLWDLGDYHCGYGDLRVSGGGGAELALHWAEALYEGPSAAVVKRDLGKYRKGQRDAVDGKVFVGFGERWTCDGAARELPALWWRSGRFVLLRVATGDQALTVERLALRSSHYPLDAECAFASSDPGIDGTLPLLLRGLQMSAHETFVDCPYYEQLLYGGDGRLEFLTAYAVARDDRLSRRCLELFDWSRWCTGIVAERYPSRDHQGSATYGMLFPLMVRDHLWWRGDATFARERLTGVRCLVEQMLALAGGDGLLGRLPGWSFIDWVPEWDNGMGPGVASGDSSIINLHWVLCLQAAAEIEDAVGEAAMAQRCRALAARVGAATVGRWWDDRRALLADDASRRLYSEHAQCLALIAGILPPADARRCLDAWLAATDLAKATVYFSYYPLEALYRAGRGDEMVRRLDFWKGLKAQGFTTTVEQPEPSRSDCHGWGAHPLWHLQASIAGIRPAGPGFGGVIVAPVPGPLTRFDATCPHPAGAVRVRWDRDAAGWSAEVTLPAGVGGLWRFAGQERALAPGLNRLRG